MFDRQHGKIKGHFSNLLGCAQTIAGIATYAPYKAPRHADPSYSDKDCRSQCRFPGKPSS